MYFKGFIFFTIIASVLAIEWFDDKEIGFNPNLPKDTNVDPNGPVIYYQRGYKDRTETMTAHITKNHLDKGTATNKAARDYAHSMGKPNDDAGHILAARLGGSGTDLRNIFPQSLNINRGVWAQMEATVADEVKNHGSANYAVSLVYDSPTATRPTRLHFRIVGGNNQANDIVNP